MTRQRHKRHSRLIVVLGLLSAIAGCTADLWYSQANREVNSGPFFVKRLVEEQRSFWLVPNPSIPQATALLRQQSVVPLSTEDARALLGEVPNFDNTRPLFLIRGVNVRVKPIPLRVFYSASGVVHVDAGSFSTCYMSTPGTQVQPLVIALQSLPKGVSMSYSCAF